MLASPAYGERWGRHWLDQARYADSNGFTIDSPRSIWKYRDWVISAINDDLPFDQFAIEQLAGDLLPKHTPEEVVATGFHRNTLVNEEGGVDKEQFRIEAVMDRVNTTGTVFLGLTVGCAQCHHHKFDPISQRDYYNLFAIFNNCDEPTFAVASADQARRLKQLERQIAAGRKAARRARSSFDGVAARVGAADCRAGPPVAWNGSAPGGRPDGERHPAQPGRRTSRSSSISACRPTTRTTSRPTCPTAKSRRFDSKPSRTLSLPLLGPRTQRRGRQFRAERVRAAGPAAQSSGRASSSAWHADQAGGRHRGSRARGLSGRPCHRRRPRDRLVDRHENRQSPRRSRADRLSARTDPQSGRRRGSKSSCGTSIRSRIS